MKALKKEKSQNPQYFRSFSPNRNANMAILGPGEIVGEDLISSDTHSYTCKVYSLTATIFCMSKSDFLLRIQNEDTQSTIIKSNQIRNLDRGFRINSLKNLSNLVTESSESIAQSVKNTTTNKNSFIFRIKQRSVTPLKKHRYRLLQDSDIKNIISKSRLDIACGLTIDFNKKNKGCKYSPLSRITSCKFFENKYLYPLKIEQKRIYSRRISGKDRVKL